MQSIKNIFLLFTIVFGLTLFLSPHYLSAQGALKVIQQQQKKTEEQKNSNIATFTNEDLEKIIITLEDPVKRDELVKALKLIQAGRNILPQETTNTSTASKFLTEEALDKRQEIKNSFSELKDEIIKKSSKLRINFKASRLKAIDILKSLIEKETLNTWVPFIRNLLIWALGCLIFAFIFYKKYLRVQTFHDSLKSHLFNTIKYFALTAIPICILIISIALLPSLSKDAETIESAKALFFIQNLFSYFFIVFSVLYLAKRFAILFFSINNKGEMIGYLSPKVAIYLIRAWVKFCNYLAFFIFIKWAILDHLAAQNLEFVLTGLLILPFPIIGSQQIWNFHKLISEPDFKATSKPENNLEDAKYPYTFNKIIKSHWAAISIFYLWMVSMAAIFLHEEQGIYFLQSFLVSLLAIFFTVSIVLLQRLIIKKIVNPTKNNKQGRSLVLAIDTLTNIVVWVLALIIILLIWGFPLDKIATNPLTKDILGRLTGIIFVLIMVVLVLRFNRMITEWILSSSEMLKSRTWRTMAPIMQTLVKVLTIFIALIVILERLGVNIGPILAGAGILGLGVGMGAQSLIKDIINGVSILLMDAVAIGDIVEINEIRGTVDSIGLRTFRMRDIKGNLVVIPNSSVDTIINLSKDFSQDVLDVLIPYDADTDQAIEIIKNSSRELEENPIWSDLILSPLEIMGVQMLDERGTTIRVRTHTVAGFQFNLSRELRLRIKRGFMAAGFKAPYQKFIVDQVAREQNLNGITPTTPKKNTDPFKA